MLARESSLLQRFEAVVADTQCHADYFCREFRLLPEKVGVIPVGAEPGLFVPQPWEAARPRVRVLFYGSFIGLQGPEVIAAAARLVPEVDWHFIGDGPLKPRCQELCQGLPYVTFTPWIPYDQLPSQIGAADILLGVFGTSQKASRVIPNKVYQALACGRVVVTRVSDAYPEALLGSSVSETGMQFILAGSAEAMADVIRRLALSRSELPRWGGLARQSYEHYFNPDSIVSRLQEILARVMS